VAGSVTAPAARARLDLGVHVRRLAAASCAAALVGALVGGLGGRLAMRLLAMADPRTAGLTTDDGFEVGQITAAGTLNLIGAGIQIGLVGSIVYLVVRPLLLGPTWLRVTTVAVGAGSTVGALLVKPTAFDFQAFDPPMLPVALFVAIPVLHVAVFAALTERWVRDGSWFRTAPLRRVGLTLLVWVLGVFALVIVAPAAALCVGLLVLADRLRPSPTLVATMQWAGRGVLVAVFLWAVVDLAADISYLLA
jgi:hypothetical protein